MQRREHQVACVGSADGRLKGDGIAHFAHHDDVRILAKHVLEASLEAVGIETDLTLLDHRLVVLEDKLDGVFQGDNVLFEVGVDVLDHRRQCCGLAGSGGSRHQDDASRG